MTPPLPNNSDWTRERLIEALGKVADGSDAKNSEIISACREIARLIGAYDTSETELDEDPLMEFMAKIRGSELDG